MATIAACSSFSPTLPTPPSPAIACKRRVRSAHHRRVGTAHHLLGVPMSRKIIFTLLAVFALALNTSSARAQQPIGVIAIDWNNESPSGQHGDYDLVSKSLKAAFADTLKKKLNVPDPAAVADLEMVRDGNNIRLVIMPKGAVQPTQDEILAAVKESFLDVVKNFFNDYHARELREIRAGA